MPSGSGVPAGGVRRSPGPLDGVKTPLVPSLNVAFMGVNRGGSTSILRTLEASFGADAVVPTHANDALAEHPDWFAFAFVREPWERVVSCYLHNIWRGRVSYSLRRHGFTPRMSFKSFVARICDIPDDRADRHFISQHYRLTHGLGAYRPDFTGRLEAFAEDWARLQAIFVERGLPRLLPVRRKAKHTDNKRKLCGQLPADDANLRRLVERRFARDYEFFGYPRLRG